jgi:hypothetical protein
MGIDERARHDLYVGLEELMGTERADALMGLLPPVGWADVATKHDLGALEERIGLRFEALEHRIEGRLHAELRSQMRTLFFGLLTALLTMASVCIAAIALAR